MFSALFQWLEAHLHQTLVSLTGIAILTSALLYPQWWGERSWGVLIGASVTTIFMSTIGRAILNVSPNAVSAFAWLGVIIPTATALIVRKPSAPADSSLPIQLHFPIVPSPQSVALILVGLVLLILLWVFFRALNQGEGVAIESHWGGLGGGIGGWRLSAPLIYLLGIVFLLGVSATLAWRVFPPPREAAGASPASTSSPSPSTSLSPSPAASVVAAAASPAPSARPSPTQP